jgi:uncharacterized protein (TIGR00730 family)
MISNVRRVCVFCGSRFGARVSYLEEAKALGRSLARRGVGLVYGGASVGLMGALADEVLAAGGEVIGVIPQALVDPPRGSPAWGREVAHRSLTQLHVVDGMHARKAKMNELSDAFVAMPGGLGTFEELFEVASWGMLGLHRKPIALLDVEGYWEPLEQMMRRAIDEGFVDPKHAALFVRVSRADAVLDAVEVSRPSPSPQLLRPDET